MSTNDFSGNFVTWREFEMWVYSQISLLGADKNVRINCIDIFIPTMEELGTTYTAIYNKDTNTLSIQ